MACLLSYNCYLNWGIWALNCCEKLPLNPGSMKIIVHPSIVGNNPDALCSEARNLIASGLNWHGRSKFTCFHLQETSFMIVRTGDATNIYTDKSLRE